MSIKKTIAVECDFCGSRITPPPHIAPTGANARLIAASHGWRKRGTKDECHICQERSKRATS